MENTLKRMLDSVQQKQTSFSSLPTSEKIIKSPSSPSVDHSRSPSSPSVDHSRSPSSPSVDHSRSPSSPSADHSRSDNTKSPSSKEDYNSPNSQSSIDRNSSFARKAHALRTSQTSPPVLQEDENNSLLVSDSIAAPENQYHSSPLVSTLSATSSTKGSRPVRQSPRVITPISKTLGRARLGPAPLHGSLRGGVVPKAAGAANTPGILSSISSGKLNRRTRSKSLPGLPSWLLSRRSHSSTNSTTSTSNVPTQLTTPKKSTTTGLSSSKQTETLASSKESVHYSSEDEESVSASNKQAATSNNKTKVSKTKKQKSHTKQSSNDSDSSLRSNKSSKDTDSSKVVVKTSSNSTSVIKTRQSSTSKRAAPKQFVTAFDWLKSYAKGQVETEQSDDEEDEDEDSEDEDSTEEEPETPISSSKSTNRKLRKKPSRNFSGFSTSSQNTTGPQSSLLMSGGNSEEEEEYDEEELELISDTDDVDDDLGINSSLDEETTSAYALVNSPSLLSMSGKSKSNRLDATRLDSSESSEQDSSSSSFNSQVHKPSHASLLLANTGRSSPPSTPSINAALLNLNKGGSMVQTDFFKQIHGSESLSPLTKSQKRRQTERNESRSRSRELDKNEPQAQPKENKQASIEPPLSARSPSKRKHSAEVASIVDPSPKSARGIKRDRKSSSKQDDQPGSPSIVLQNNEVSRSGSPLVRSFTDEGVSPGGVSKQPKGDLSSLVITDSSNTSPAASLPGSPASSRTGSPKRSKYTRSQTISEEQGKKLARRLKSRDLSFKKEDSKIVCSASASNLSVAKNSVTDDSRRSLDVELPVTVVTDSIEPKSARGTSITFAEPTTPTKSSLSTTNSSLFKKTPDIVRIRKRSIRQGPISSQNTHSAVSANSVNPGAASLGESASANRTTSQITDAAATAALPEFDENGVKYTILENGSRFIHAISADQMLRELFEGDWNKERTLRDEFLMVLPFFASPAYVIEFITQLWTKHIQSNSYDTSNDTLQKKIIGFMQEWIKTNFSYYNDSHVLDALFKLLDKLGSFHRSTLTNQTQNQPHQISASNSIVDSVLHSSNHKPSSKSHKSPRPSLGSSNASVPLSPNPIQAQKQHSAPNTPSQQHDLRKPSSPTALPLESILEAKKLQEAQLSGSGGKSAQSSPMSPNSTSMPADAAYYNRSSSGSSLSDSSRFIIARDLLKKIVQYKLAGIDPKDLAGLVARMKHPKFGVKCTSGSSSHHLFLGSDAIKWLKKHQEDNLVDTPNVSFFKRFQEKVDVLIERAPLSARNPHNSSSHPSSPPSTLQRETTFNTLLEIDNIEVLSQLLKEKLIAPVSSRTGLVRQASSSSSSEDDGIFNTIKKKKMYTFTIPPEIEQNAIVQNLIPIERNASQRSNSSNGNSSHGNSSSDLQSFFLETQPDAFARQLAIFEFSLFKRIETHELHFWLKGDKSKRPKHAVNLNHVITNINRMSSWVSTEIVTTANPKQRISTLKRFILVAQYCLKYKNYQGLLEIMGGLSNTSVRRLSAWNSLPEKYNDMYNKLSEIVNPAQNWKNYRPLIEHESQACIPYIGLFLSDITFINDGVSTKIEDGRLNWKKAARLALLFSRIRRLQRRAYIFAPDLRILTYLSEELVHLDDKELYSRSRLIEPARARSGSIY